MAERAVGAIPKIGIFGGSFDPVHGGHVEVARTARDRGGLDRVLWMVAAVSPFKQGNRGSSAPAESRWAMVKLAIASEVAMDVSDLELRRPGPSYTIDTIRAVRAAEPAARLFLVLGSDSLPMFPKWRDAAAIVAEAAPIIVPRRGVGREVLTQCQEQLGAEAGRVIEAGWIDRPFVDVSSTEIRERLAARKPLTGLVPEAVERYIADHGLYR